MSAVRSPRPTSRAVAAKRWKQQMEDAEMTRFLHGLEQDRAQG